MKRKYWFRSKYGLGWYPTTFKGFFVFVAYFAFVLYSFFSIDSKSHSISDILIAFAPFLFGATIILLFICYINGEPIKS